MRFDTVVIGGGIAGMREAMAALASGKKVALFCNGRTLDNVDYPAFTRAGGNLLMGDRVLSGEIAGNQVCSVTSERLGKVVADEYVLATGRFFSRGLYADMNRIREMVFELDVDAPVNPAEWVSADFDAPQPFLKCGVITDSEGCPFKNGVKLLNLKVVGDIVSKMK